MRDPEYGVPRCAVGRAMERRGRRLVRACVSNVKRYLWAKGRPGRDLVLVRYRKLACRPVKYGGPP